VWVNEIRKQKVHRGVTEMPYRQELRMRRGIVKIATLILNGNSGESKEKMGKNKDAK